MAFRAIFCDIDGTLLDSAHALRPATASRVREVHEAGTPFILVSARSPSGIFHIQERIGIKSPIVGYGGALVLDDERTPVHSLDIDMRRVVAMKERIRADWPGVLGTVYCRDNWFVDDATHPKIVREAEITGAPACEIAPADLPARENVAHKIFCVGDPADILDMEARLSRENPDLAVIKSDPKYLEITNEKATKANALKYLCQAMRLSPAEVVAFGDNYNDVGMLECAGLGIAMQNAPDEVRRRADKVTASNDDEGVRQALEWLPLGPLSHSVRFERAMF